MNPDRVHELNIKIFDIFIRLCLCLLCFCFLIGLIMLKRGLKINIINKVFCIAMHYESTVALQVENFYVYISELTIFVFVFFPSIL